MKDLKLKDLVVEHYRKVYETKMDGITVRVWKPKTMGKLPTYAMLSELKTRVRDAILSASIGRKVSWTTGNPDFGAWDAQIARRFDPRNMTLDIYFAALLIRPFSQQAFDWYNMHATVNDPVMRLVLMWDSREFDRSHGFDTSFGAYDNQKEIDEYMYSGKAFGIWKPINDPNFDPQKGYGVGEPEQDFAIKFRHKGGQVEVETSSPLSSVLLKNMDKYLKPTMQNFRDFTGHVNGIKEIHYYTDITQWECDTDQAEAKVPTDAN